MPAQLDLTLSDLSPGPGKWVNMAEMPIDEMRGGHWVRRDPACHPRWGRELCRTVLILSSCRMESRGPVSSRNTYLPDAADLGGPSHRSYTWLPKE